MHTGVRPWLLPVVLASVVWLAACGGSTPQPSPSPSLQRFGEYPPPTWVQNEVAWQSLNNGDAHPGECFWKLTVASRAAALDGHATSYLKGFTDARSDMAYVIVLHGHFESPDFPGKTFTAMYFVILKNHNAYVASGLVPAPHKVRRLPAMHSYSTQLPVSSGVWGHTMAAGGPFPGGPFPLGDIPVAVYAGRKAAGRPLTTVRSDADGFFTLDLQPGLYTLVMTAKNHGFPSPATVTVREGRPVAAGVYGQMM